MERGFKRHCRSRAQKTWQLMRFRSREKSERNTALKFQASVTEEILTVLIRLRKSEGRSSFVMLMKISVSGEFDIPNSNDNAHHAADKSRS